MRNVPRFLPAVALVLLASACDTTPGSATDTAATATTAGSPASSNAGANADAIRALDETWLRWAMSKNVDSMLTLYSDDAHSFMGGQKPITDAGARRRSFDEFVGMNLRDGKLDNMGVTFSEDRTMAVSYGTYSGTMTMGGCDMKDEGSYVNVYKRTPQGWKYVVDMNASSVPVGPPPGSAARQ